MKIEVKSLLNGLMVYWEEVKEAARYYVHLVIGDKHKQEVYENGRMTTKYDKETFQEIGLIEVERNTKYYSFINLARIDKDIKNGSWFDTGKNYYIYVEAENKSGEIIKKSESIVGQCADYRIYH